MSLKPFITASVALCLSLFRVCAQDEDQPPQYCRQYEVTFNEIRNTRTGRMVVKSFDSTKKPGKLEMYSFQVIHTPAYEGYVFAGGRIYDKKTDDYDNGILWIRLNDDDTYTVIVPYGAYESASYFGGDNIPAPFFKCVRKDGLYALVDGGGRVCFDGAASLDYYIVEGCIYNYAVWPDGHMSVIDQDGGAMFSEYESAAPLEGTVRFKARRDGQWGLLSKDGEVILPFIYREDELLTALQHRHLESYGFYMKSDWEHLRTTKDEWETQAEFEARKSSEEAQSLYIREHTKGSVFQFGCYVLKHNGTQCRFSIGDYDADRMVFELRCSLTPRGRYWIPVSRDIARTFKYQFSNLKVNLHTVRCFIENDGLSISGMTVTMPDGTDIEYVNPAFAAYDGESFELAKAILAVQK